LISDVTASDMLDGDFTSSKDEAFSGLVALGFSEQDARSALSKVDKDLSLQDRIKEALKNK